jgi:ketol-acid reductoisomerase
MDVVYERDVPTGILAHRTIAIIGFGSQGRAQALNLRDSGCAVIVGLRAGSPRRAAAESAGLRVDTPQAATAAADVVMLLAPDEAQPAIFAEQVAPHLRPGSYLGFAHGLAVHYRKIVPAADTNVFLCAPKGIGPMVRQQYVDGAGVAALIAVYQDPAGDTRDVACAYACALGCGRVGILETTFREETETDLFGEQAVLCGGLTELIRAGFETLVEAGYAPEMAYFECLHEVKLIADLVHARGIAGMREAISNTAAFGDVTRGRRVIGPATRTAMREILVEIQSGAFADEWLAEHAAGQPTLRARIAESAAHPIEAAGRPLRALMPWLDTGASSDSG